MKINAVDFKNLHNGRKIVKILRDMASLKKGASPFPLYHQLMALVGETNPHESVPLIFTYLVGMAMESTDISFVNFVVTMKLGFYQRGDLEELSNMDLRHYVAAMHNLRKNLPLHPTKNLPLWEEEFKTLYVWNAFMIHCFSPVTLVLSKQGQFDKAFKVKCQHCGNDIHSLYIDLDKAENTSTIRTADLDGEVWDELNCDDAFVSFSALCNNFNEQYFSKILPYVYGHYHCSVCKKENLVMDALLAYHFQEEPWFVPSDKFLTRLRKMCFAMGNHIALEKWVFSSFVLAQYRIRFGYHSSIAMEFILEIAEDLGEHLPDGIFADLLKQAEKVEILGEYNVVLCRVKAGFYQRTAPEKVADCFQRGLASAGDTWMERQLRRDYALYLAETVPEEGEKHLLDLYNSLKTPDDDEYFWRMEQELVDFYRKQGNLSQSIFYQKKIFQRSRDLYGDESEILGEQGNFLGALYLEEGQFDLAKEVCQEVFAMQLSVIEKSTALPSPLGQGRKKIPSKIQDEHPNLPSRGRLAGVIAVNLGHIALKEGELLQSLEYYRQGSALWAWGSDLDFAEEGNHLYYQATVYLAMGKTGKAKSLAKKAIKIYRKRLKESKIPEELEECQRRLEMAEKIS